MTNDERYLSKPGSEQSRRMREVWESLGCHFDEREDQSKLPQCTRCGALTMDADRLGHCPSCAEMYEIELHALPPANG